MKNIVYSLCCLAFAIVVGGAVYEHRTVVPEWTAAPPVSLSMFQGEYGLKPENFWMYLHPVGLFLFITTMILHWKTEARKNLLIVFISYILVLVITSIYFVPELIDITKTTYSQLVDEDLTRRAGLWETLSLIRLAVLIVLSCVLFLGLTKTSKLNARSKASRVFYNQPAEVVQ